VTVSRAGAAAAEPVVDADTQRRALEDGYRLLREIGSGAVSTVYEAEQLEVDRSRVRRKVALKVLRPTIAPSSSFAEPMVREARLLDELGHPNVVRMLGAVRTGDRLSIALELVRGENLAQRMNREQRLPVARAVSIALSVARGLAYLHERGLVHRDVKPQNILLSSDGQVKLADLGIAEVMPDSPLARLEPVSAAGKSSARRDGASFGTPAYMAPEALLAEGVAPVDPRTDLFSLGVTLYEMLSGARPFEADPSSPDAVVLSGPRSRARGRRERAEPLGKRAPEVPRAIERIVMKLVERRPEDRFSSAAELVHVLERAESGLGRDGRFDVRQLSRVQQAGLAGIAVVLLAGAGFGVARWRHRAAEGAAAVNASGSVRVTAHPWAEIWVDGALRETTPVARPLMLAVGPHEVVLKNPYFADEHRRITVAAGEPTLLDVVMTTPLDATADAGARR
jgi:serine/threonine protein kinase